MALDNEKLTIFIDIPFLLRAIVWYNEASLTYYCTVG
jgi:hypothetical protein